MEGLTVRELTKLLADLDQDKLVAVSCETSHSAVHLLEPVDSVHFMDAKNDEGEEVRVLRLYAFDDYLNQVFPALEEDDEAVDA